MKPFTLITILCLFFVSCNSSQKNDSLVLKDKQNKKAIIVYGSDTCHYCIDTKSYLEKNNIPYTFFDIDKNEKALQQMLNKLNKAKIDVTNLNIPVIEKNGEIFTNDINFEDFLKKIKQ
ncbi:MAG: glutaredoxin 3 [Olleya marilimosa]|jgi:glutaredoxin 3|uniref:Glutaredoxin family protein n=1 Tax=Olleya marilimosa TaxID=272164 RepID=A0ABR8LUY8_9FLAO|nr:glutaredoxin family protein [Olleya marilimosa]MBD3863987.1 glutaredoxin family protein [Olleya marilimosa]